MTTPEDRQVLFDRLVDEGAAPAEARRTAGLPPEPTPARASRLARSRRRRRRGRPPRITLAPASSFGAVFAQMLGLVLLYWVIRSAGAINTILERIGSAVRWLVEPVGWGVPTNR